MFSFIGTMTSLRNDIQDSEDIQPCVLRTAEDQKTELEHLDELN